MKKSNIHSTGGNRKINPNWFTNKVHMKDISSVIGTEGQNIYHVYFENGAKTKLHLHNGNQILIATKGNGELVTFKKYGSKRTNFAIKQTSRVTLREGDVVHIPKNTLHTHGSVDKRKTFSHIAINLLQPGTSDYKTIWYESDFRKSVGTIVK